MLTQIIIKNFALIEQLEISFSNQFSIITGETGAGKSILLGALGLALGNRADLGSLKNKEQKCVIEVHFSIANYNLKAFFEENALDYEETTIIRREILPSGKSRAFINDSPATLTSLQALGKFLIDIHSQHQTHELLEENYQINVLDAVANNTDLRLEYATTLKQYKADVQKLKKIRTDLETLSKEHDYNTFLLHELQTAQLKEGEQAHLEANFETLNNVELIKENVIKAITLANEEQIGVISQLNEIKNALQKVSTLATEYNSLFERISSLTIEFDDITVELERHAENLINDPEKLETLSQKLQLIYALQKKHNVASVEDLLTIKNDLELKVNQIDSLDTNISELEKNISAQAEILHNLASKITASRKKASTIFITQIAKIVATLGMENAQFEFEFLLADQFLNSGKDTVQLLFSANKGGHFGNIKKVASGGEMSRIMLAVKAVLATYSSLPTIIFDEIDTGVSGEVAQKMATIMKEMSNNMQVFAITHLPQIASKGDQHYKVFKRDINDTTQSDLKLLSYEERVNELAEMISGKNYPESAIVHAKALLN